VFLFIPEWTAPVTTRCIALVRWCSTGNVSGRLGRRRSRGLSKDVSERDKTGRAKFNSRGRGANEWDIESLVPCSRSSSSLCRYSNSRIRAILGALVWVLPRSIECTLESGTSGTSDCIFVSTCLLIVNMPNHCLLLAEYVNLTRERVDSSRRSVLLTRACNIVADVCHANVWSTEWLCYHCVVLHSV